MAFSTVDWRRRLGRSVMKSHRIQIPLYHIPVRFRPWFLVFTSLVMLLLAFLGFTNFSRALPLNDKLLHFLCFALATAVFYFIFDVEEDARRIWFWRYSNIIFTGFVCFFCGGIISEFVQSMLPYKQFQWGDVFANLFGSSIGLFVSFHAEKYYRHRREIARLYRPLDTDGDYADLDEEEDPLAGTQLLPTHYSNNKPSNKLSTASRLANVWDEREELFGIGDDDDDDDLRSPAPPAAGPLPPQTPIPKITVTHHDHRSEQS